MITGVFIREINRRVREGGYGDGSKGLSQREILEDAVLLALKTEEGATSQGKQVPPESGKG